MSSLPDCAFRYEVDPYEFQVRIEIDAQRLDLVLIAQAAECISSRHNLDLIRDDKQGQFGAPVPRTLYTCRVVCAGIEYEAEFVRLLQPAPAQIDVVLTPVMTLEELCSAESRSWRDLQPRDPSPL